LHAKRKAPRSLPLLTHPVTRRSTAPTPRLVLKEDVLHFFLILHNIQLTAQKLSAARKNLPGATGAGEWPEDHKLHRGRRPGRRRYQEVLLLWQKNRKKKDIEHAPAPILKTSSCYQIDLYYMYLYACSCFQVGLYKIFVHFKAFVHESVILVSPPPTCNAHTIAVLLHDLCAIYDRPSTPLLNAIHHSILATAISCKGQLPGRSLDLVRGWVDAAQAQCATKFRLHVD